MISRISFLVPVVLLLLLGSAALLATQQGGRTADSADSLSVEVYLAPTCGCCGEWVAYLEEEGVAVTTHEVDQATLNDKKREAGLRAGLASCHTAFVEGYVIEGHVPLPDIRRLLEERPDVAGLTVPGMPVGSPGMEMGDRRDPYDVLTFRADGETEVFASY